jgi:CheY-like chemotaxis protein
VIYILLADDDRDDCFFFKDAVEELKLPVQLTTVWDGEQLMRHLSQTDNVLPYALFLDLNMPRKNGHTCLIEIKSSKTLSNIPVIIFSTSYDEQVADELYKIGAHYYIRKPPAFSDFKEAIKSAYTFLQRNIGQPHKEKFLISKQKPAL